jgi:quinol-cytochrome oxidoreductase complex cytochrome b subunit
MLGLKGFHIFFIVISILLCLVVGAWGAQRYLQAESTGGLVTAVVFFIAGFLLLAYGVRYFGKLRRLD